MNANMLARNLADFVYPYAGVGRLFNKPISCIPLRCQIIAQTTTQKPAAAARKTTITKRRTLKVKPTQLEGNFKMEWPKVTLFGDSITRRSFDVNNGCWGSMIAFEMGDYFDVDCRGFEGYNSRWALELMPKLFPRSYLDKVEIFVPFFGHNDAFPLTLHVPIDEYERNMRSIVSYLTDNGLSKDKIILMTPTWYEHEAFSKFCLKVQIPAMKKTIEEQKRYSDAILTIARDNNISVVDFFNITANYQPLGELFCDGIHYSEKGAKLLFDNLMPIIEKKVEDRFGKPLSDLYHAVPFDQIPAVAKALKAYQKAKL